MSHSLSEEISDLLSLLSERNSAILVKRWGYGVDPQPTLAEIGDQYGISRERVRQIVARFRKKVRSESAAARAVTVVGDTLEEAGGALPTQELLSKLDPQLSFSSLGVDESLLSFAAELSNVVGDATIAYSRKYRLWVTKRGQSRISQGGDLFQARRRMRRIGIRQLQAYSSIDGATIGELAHWTIDHACEMSLADYGPFVAAGRFRVPTPTPDSKLTRRADKILAVSDPILLSRVIGGLQRSMEEPIPPSLVLQQIFSTHPHFQRKQNRISTTDSHPGSRTLSTGDEVAILLLEEHNAMMLRDDFLDGMMEFELSEALANVLLSRAPYIERVAYSIYALRGRSQDANRLSRLKRQRDQRRGPHVLSCRQLSIGIWYIRYRLNRMSQKGVLTVPSDLTLSPGSWAVRTDGRSIGQVTVKNRFIWGIYDWLKDIDANLGDILAVTIHKDQGLLEVELVPEEGEHHG